jgi:hypothetical protein
LNISRRHHWTALGSGLHSHSSRNSTQSGPHHPHGRRPGARRRWCTPQASESLRYQRLCLQSPPAIACPREEPKNTSREISAPGLNATDIPLRVAWFRPGARTNPFPARARKGTDSGLASKLLAERLEDGKVLNAFFLGLHLSPPGSGTGRTPPDALAFPPSRNHLASRMPPT